MTNPRIIAGKVKGLRLKSVPGDTTRPITDRVKEALFNIIGGDIEDSQFLDLFGGTGSVAIEALSRGASFARIIELNHNAVGIIKSNLRLANFSNLAEVIQANAFSYLQRSTDRKFEYCYIAPPQYKGMWEESLELIDKNMDLLTDDAWVIVQIHPIEYKPITLKNLQEFDQRKYGSTLLVFYSPKN